MPGRDYVQRAYGRRAAKDQNLTPEQKAAARTKKAALMLVPVPTAPVVGDWEAVDWMACDCGYVPQAQANGKPMPQTREPAWQWTEEPGSTGKSCLRTHVRDLALKVYRIGYRHGNVALYDDGGFPDDMYWGRFGPRLIVRELKAMRPDWKRGQKQHLLSLQEADVDVAVWKPCCLLSGLIDEEMAKLAGVKPKGAYARNRHGQPNARLTWQNIAEGALDEAG